MKSFLHRLCNAASVLLFLLMLSMVVIMNSLVMTRYFFSWSPSWTEELTRYAMVWMVMIGAAILALFEDHITLYLFNDKFGPRVRAVTAFFIRLLVAIICGVVAQTGFKFAFSMANIMAPGSGLSMTVPTIAIPIAASIIVLFCVLLMINDVLVLLGRAPFSIPKQSFFMDGSFRPADDLPQEKN